MPLRKKKSTKVKNVTPKTYKGVLYKSSLEAYCAQALTEAGLPVNYEQVKFQILDPFTCPSTSIEFKLKRNKSVPLTQNLFQETSSRIRGMVYTPDFTDMGKRWIIETKGVRDQAFIQRFKLFRNYLYRNSLQFRIYVPNNRSQIDETITHILSTNAP